MNLFEKFGIKTNNEHLYEIAFTHGSYTAEYGLDYNYERFTKKIPYPKLRIRKMTSRWGVCNTQTHVITLNLELIKRDISYLDYVIIHEMSHLIHGDHSTAFWKLVEDNMPNYKKYREEMKEF